MGKYEDEEEDEEPCPISNSDAARMFEWCLTWLECQHEATVYNTTVLRELQAMATKKRMYQTYQSESIPPMICCFINLLDHNGGSTVQAEILQEHAEECIQKENLSTLK